MKSPPARPTLASFIAAYGPSRGPRLWGFLVTLSLVGRDRLQEMGLTRTAVFKNLRELTTHPGLQGENLLGRNVRGRAPRELLVDLVEDFVEAAYQGVIPYREFRDLAEVLHAQADRLEEALRERAGKGPLEVTLSPPKRARASRLLAASVRKGSPHGKSPTGRPPMSSAPSPSTEKPATKRRKPRRFVSGQGYCELCTTTWPQGWAPAYEHRSLFRCLGCDEELDAGLRVPPQRFDTPSVDRPDTYVRPEPPVGPRR